MNDNANPEDVKRAIKDARVRAGRAKMKGDTGDEKFNNLKLKTLKQFVKEDWKRAALIGGSTVAASALTSTLKGMGPIPGAVIGATYYTLSGNLRKDLRYRRKKTLNEKNWEKWWYKKAIKKATKAHIAKAEARKKFKEKHKDD